MTTWRKASNFLPALWLAPKIQDKPACALAVGRYLVGVLQNYEAKQNPKFGNMDHFYQVAVSESSEKEAHMYDPDNKANDGYTTVAAEYPNVYTIKASGLLHHLLQGFWSNPQMHMGRPLKITYAGTKEFVTDNPNYDPNAQAGPNSKMKLTVNSHQYSVEMDEDYTPQLAAPAPVRSLGQDATGANGPVPEAVEEPLPAFDENA